MDDVVPTAEETDDLETDAGDVDEDSDSHENIDDGLPDEEPEAEPSTTDGANDEEEIEEVTVDLAEDEIGGESLFDGVEDADPEETEVEEQETDGSASLDGDETLAETINDGAARLAVIGLTDADFEGNQTKNSLETELQETFEAFRLGYFGSRAAEKYVLSPSEDEIDPAWGLLGAAIMAAALTLMLRPDGDEKIDDLRETVGDLTGGALG